jgi:hypothetical protein
MFDLLLLMGSVVAGQFMALVFLLASGGKLLAGSSARHSVEAYNLLPPALAQFVGSVLPWVELAIAASLLTGIMGSWAVAAALALLLVFFPGASKRLATRAGGPLRLLRQFVLAPGAMDQRAGQPRFGRWLLPGDSGVSRSPQLPTTWKDRLRAASPVGGGGSPAASYHHCPFDRIHGLQADSDKLES